MDLSKISVSQVITTSDADIVTDFYIPMLRNSVRYDRGVGFFSASWLRLTAHGMINFAQNRGQARWITSPILSKSDWDALKHGEEARHDVVIRNALERNIIDLARDLETDTLSALAWLVADRILDFRLALPRNKLAGGEFHDKFGIFADELGNQVSFSGSNNESEQGTINYESFKVFSSWEPALATFVQEDARRFERLWNNQDPNLQVYTLPEAALAQILKLRTGERPYKLNRAIAKAAWYMPQNLYLRDYQLDAIEAWLKNDGRGFLEMATGTGKTLTALSAAIRMYAKNGQKLAIIIAVPYQHLVDQWLNETKEFGFMPILAYESKKSWIDQLTKKMRAYKRGDIEEMMVITTHTTFGNSDFQNIIRQLPAPTLLIADEAHHLGAENSRLNLPQNITYRLALSATPDRWFDDSGTKALRSYFGDTVFTFSLEDAIQRKILVSYRYYPKLVELTDVEIQEYAKLSEKIAKLINVDNDEAQKNLELLLFKRALLLNRASNKLVELSKLLKELGEKPFSLFYCAPEQIDNVSHLLAYEHDWRIARFTSEESNEMRQEILSEFANQRYRALVAMKCLDEGVDVPDTRIAFILASSSNPREFIQRRGRILRRAEGKTSAIVYDFIVIPPRIVGSGLSPTGERSILERELARFREFSNAADNKHEALDVLLDIARNYGIVL
jgi:DNA phosphorothioation system restriction enzyme